MFTKKLGQMISGFDDRLRFTDLALHRTYGGLLGRIGINRHSCGVILLPALVCGLIVAGSPSPGMRLVLAGFACIVSLIVIAVLTSSSERRGFPVWTDLLIQLSVTALIGCIVWFASPDNFKQNVLYRHLFIALAFVVGLSLLFAAVLAGVMFRDLQTHSNLHACLKNTELFASRGAIPPVTFWSMIRSGATVLLRAPLHLLLLPAVAGMLLPPYWLVPGVVAAWVISFAALFFAGLNQRFSAMWCLLQSGLFRGGAFLVSVLVIIIAGMRLANFSYVTTVLDTAAGQVIAYALSGAYVLSWWYDYWAGRLLAQQVLLIIDESAGNQAATAYPIEPTRVSTHVPATGRILQVHGSSRLIVIRPTKPSEEMEDAARTAAAKPALETQPVTYFQAYEMAELAERLAVSGAPGGRARPSPDRIRDRMSDYYRLIAASAILLALSIGWTIHKGEQLPEVTASASGPGLPLSGFVFDNAHLEGRRPVIVLAASGGGTRAALYTASVLEALASTGHASDVILGSGVSGGGAALAYFAGCRPGLLQKDDSARVRKWNQFFEAMQQPFIQDVLERASEWRMVTGGRLGFLLAESFERRWGLPPERQTLGGVKDFGLILNTALAGSFDIDDLPQQVQKLPLPDAERRFRDEYTRPELAGGRLILTNLAWDRAFTSEILEGYTRHPLPIVVNDPSVRLERAAALNANFPPVFSNAAVDVDRTRFWVTDGGAVDNRGMEMLLYAIRRSLDSGSAGVPRSRLPRMHVIVADASAFSNEFSQDRGVSTMTAAGTRFASQLAAELVRDIKRRYAERQQDGDFSFWYLMMPDELRVSTSFGTHWMLQSRITVCHRASPVKEITLTGSEVVEVLRSLYTGADRHLTDDAKTVLAWLQEKPSQWQLLASALRGPS